MSPSWDVRAVLLSLGCGLVLAEEGPVQSSRMAVRPELAYSSYLGGRDGGAGNRAVDSANAVGVDQSGRIYVAGFTMSLDFPKQDPLDQPALFENGYYYEDVFITKMDPQSGALIYSTTLGGPGTDIAYGLAVGTDGAVYLAGRAGPEFPYTRLLGKGCEQSNRSAFVLKLSTAGDRVEWATCLCAGAYATALALGADGTVSAAGFYQGEVGADPGLPVTEGAFQPVMPTQHRGKAFVAKLSGEGELQYATWLAGNGEDMPAALAVDPNGEVLVLGTTTSNSFPVVNALQERNASGGGVAWSGDAGQDWSPRNEGLEYNDFSQVVADPFVSGTAYARSLGTGIHKTTDFGASWRSVNEGIPLTPTPNVTLLAASRAAPGLLFALAGGRIVRSEDGGLNWSVVPFKQSPMGIFPDAKSKETIYVSLAVPPSGGAGQPDFMLMRTDDGGATWRRIAADLTLGGSAAVVVDEAREGVIYLANNGYFRSEDRGETWTPLAPPQASLPPGMWPSGLFGLAPDPRQSGVLYVDFIQSTPQGVEGRLARSADDGRSWTLCGTIPNQAQAFWVDRGDSSVVYVMARQSMYRSADGCASFEPRSHGLPGRFLSSAAQDSMAPENLYVTAQPSPELFLTRLGADGKSAVFSTYLGTKEPDYAGGLALDPDGSLWLTGYTTSGAWPVSEDALRKQKSGVLEDALMMRLSGTGDSIQYSTYLGGSGSDAASSLAVTPGGEVWVAGATRSADFPLAGGLQAKFGGGQADGFVLCLTNQGRELGFSTFLGGSGNDWLSAIRVDETGSVIAAGTTSSADWPVTGQAFQPAHAGGTGEEAVVVKLSQGEQTGVTPSGSKRPGEDGPRPRR